MIMGYIRCIHLWFPQNTYHTPKIFHKEYAFNITQVIHMMTEKGKSENLFQDW